MILAYIALSQSSNSPPGTQFQIDIAISIIAIR